MDMYVELTQALIEMVKEGGVLAIWGIFVWMGMGIVKNGLVLWAICWVVQLVVNSVNSYQCFKHLGNKEKVALMSEDMSRRLELILTEYRDGMSTAMKEFIKEAKELLDSSKKSTK